jgi:hypothetical protein
MAWSDPENIPPAMVAASVDKARMGLCRSGYLWMNDSSRDDCSSGLELTTTAAVGREGAMACRAVEDGEVVIVFAAVVVATVVDIIPWILLE